MPPIYNTNYYNNGSLRTMRPKNNPAKWNHICSDGTIIGFFQGNRGAYPAVDFQIKVLLPGPNKIMFPPSHWWWTVDLIIKSHFYPQEISEILEYYIDFYDNVCAPFNTPAERDNHQLNTVGFILNKYSHVVVVNTVAIDVIATLLELFCYCEKRNQPVAHQFKDALIKMNDYCKGNIDMLDVMTLVCSHY